MKMLHHLTDALIRNLQAPERGNRIVYDDTVRGLGIRVTASGHKAFVRRNGGAS